MGSVLRALRKSESGSQPVAEPIIRVVSLAVANAEKAVRECLDGEAAVTPDAPQTTESAERATVVAAASPTITREQLMAVLAPPPPADECQAEPAAETEAVGETQSDETQPAVAEAPPAPTADSPEAPAPAEPAAPASSEAAPAATSRFSPLVVAHHSPRCRPAEQIRQLRTSLLNLVQDGPIHCMITSARPGEGKSVMAANLAYSFSELAHRRTLLIDADLYSGRAGELFGVEREVGLADLLSSRRSAHEVIRHTSRGNLDVVPASRAEPDRIGELLSDARAHRAVRELFRGYDCVILDSPAAESSADAAIIGRWVDLTLLAVQTSKTPRGLVERTIQTLQTAGVALAGIIALDEHAE